MERRDPTQLQTHAEVDLRGTNLTPTSLRRRTLAPIRTGTPARMALQALKVAGALLLPLPTGAAPVPSEPKTQGETFLSSVIEVTRIATSTQPEAKREFPLPPFESWLALSSTSAAPMHANKPVVIAQAEVGTGTTPGTSVTPQSDRSGRVLIDRSHQWLFSEGVLAREVLRPHGLDVTMSDATLNTLARPEEFETVVLIQVANINAPYSAEDISLLKNYVQSGGCLVIACAPMTPLAEVASAFGASVKSGRCSLPLLSSDWLRELGAAEQVQLKSQTALNCYLAPPPEARVALADNQGIPIACCFDFGAGKALCFADSGRSWDLGIKNPQNRGTTLALFRALHPTQTLGTSAGAAVEVHPGDLSIIAEGLTLRYSAPISTQVQGLLPLIPKIAALVKGSNRTRLHEDGLVVNMLAGGGGGYSGGKTIGIGCTSKLPFTVGVIGHELTHSYSGAFRGFFGEGWAITVGPRVARTLGFPQLANSWQTERPQLMLDQNFRELDIGSSETERRAATDIRLSRTCHKKVKCLIEDLEQSYGEEIMPCALEMARAVCGPRPITNQEMFYFLSKAANTDLASFYAARGITYKPTYTISDQDLAEKLVRCRNTQAFDKNRSMQEVVARSKSHDLIAALGAYNDAPPAISTTMTDEQWQTFDAFQLTPFQDNPVATCLRNFGDVPNITQAYALDRRGRIAAFWFKPVDWDHSGDTAFISALSGRTFEGKPASPGASFRVAVPVMDEKQQPVGAIVVFISPH